MIVFGKEFQDAKVHLITNLQESIFVAKYINVASENESYQKNDELKISK